MTMHVREIALAAALAALGASGAQADFPERTITLISPFNAGGGNDTVARLLASELEKELDTNVVVKNSTGAGGTIGAAEAANARPDGHTLGHLAIGPVTTQPHLRELTYDIDSWAPVCMTYQSPVVLTVTKDSGIDTVDDLIAQARDGGVVYGSPGPGSIPHISAFAVANAYGVEFKHLPHSGGAEIAKSMMSGHVDLLSDVASNVALFDLKPIAALHPERLEGFPDVPTMSELGHPLEFSIWFGLFAPKDTPDDVVRTLSDACEAATGTDAFAAGMERIDSPVAFMPAAEFAAFVASDYEKNGELLAAAGLQKN
jgi:tripartite-type tricarboxylate transporter receptor subunit TctC